MTIVEANKTSSTESERSKPWVVVLAGGQGTRLNQVTTAIHGTPVPKQFAVLNGVHSMLQTTVRRALWLTTPDRVLVVVNAKDADLTKEQLRDHPQVRMVLEPFSGGTALGVLLPVLMVAREHPDDDLVVMPSDHHFGRPICFVEAIQTVLANTERYDDLVLMVAEAKRPGSDLGWVVPVGPARGELGLRGVSEFVEKPAVAVAEQLMRTGGLVSTMITLGTTRGFEAAFVALMPRVTRALKALIGSHRWNGMKSAFLTFGGKNFSRNILEHLPSLKVVAFPDCDWADSGPPSGFGRSSAWMLGQGCPKHHKGAT